MNRGQAIWSPQWPFPLNLYLSNTSEFNSQVSPRALTLSAEKNSVGYHFRRKFWMSNAILLRKRKKPQGIAA